MNPAESPPPAASELAKLAINRSASAQSSITRRRPLWKRWWFWLAVVVVIGGAAQGWRSQNAPAAVDLSSVAAAYPSGAVSTLNATGRVVAARRASVSSKATGRLEWLGVQEGQRVQEGEVIARLENRDVAAQLEQARANVLVARGNLAQGEAELEDANANLRRTQELAAQKFVSGSALDTAQTRTSRARASIASLKAQIAVAEANARVAQVAYEQTLIKAPFSGLVLTKSANVGDIVTPFSSAAGTTGAVVTMADMDTLEVEADVSEASISKVTVGQPVEIQLDAYPELRLVGKVSRIVPTVDRAKATLLVKVSFVERDERVLPDMSAKAAFLSRELKPDERKPVPAVRPEAVVKRDGRDVLLVVGKDDRVSVVPVTVGEKVGDLLRIDGAAPGTRVVIAPADKLGAGSAVTAAKQ